jgi:hypothetical protein
MNMNPGIATVAAPRHPPSDFLAHESECREALSPCLDGLLDMAETAGWNRRTVASTIMYLAAKYISPSATSDTRET